MLIYIFKELNFSFFLEKIIKEKLLLVKNNFYILIINKKMEKIVLKNHKNLLYTLLLNEFKASCRISEGPLCLTNRSNTKKSKESNGVVKKRHKRKLTYTISASFTVDISSDEDFE